MGKFAPYAVTIFCTAATIGMGVFVKFHQGGIDLTIPIAAVGLLGPLVDGIRGKNYPLIAAGIVPGLVAFLTG